MKRPANTSNPKQQPEKEPRVLTPANQELVERIKENYARHPYILQCARIQEMADRMKSNRTVDRRKCSVRDVEVALSPESQASLNHFNRIGDQARNKATWQTFKQCLNLVVK